MPPAHQNHPAGDHRAPAADRDAAVRTMEEQLEKEHDGDPSAPPMREEYGGPRRSSDGDQVTPDGSEPGQK